MRKTWIVILILAVCLIFGAIYFKSIGSQDKENLEDEAISCTLNLYKRAKEKGVKFDSQCLGVCGDYVVDIVHVPRSEEDNKPENQCKEYREGKIKHFIELDKEGNIVRVI